MAGGTRTAQTAGPQTQPAADQVAIDEFVHPVVRELEALKASNNDPPFATIEHLVRDNLASYDACLRAINRLWGNQAAAQVAIAVPHISLQTFASVTGGAGQPGATPPAATPAGGGDSAGPDVDVDTDPVTGEADVSASVGPVTPHVTAMPMPTRDHPNGPQLTGANVEVAGDVGRNDNTHVSVSGGAQLDPNGHATAVGDASVTTRVNNNVAVGASGHVEGDGTSPVRVQGGASVRLRLNDVASLRAAGAVDSEGVLSQEVALEILTDPSPRVPISDDAHRRLRFFLRATEPTQIGGDPNNQTGAGVQGGIGGTF